MNLKPGFPRLALALFACFCAALAAAAMIMAAGLSAEEGRLLLPGMAGWGALLVLVALPVLVATLGLAAWLTRIFVTPLCSLAEQTRLATAVNSGRRVHARGGHEILDLAAAINQLADARYRLESEFESKVGASNARLEEERNRLAAVMSGLTEGVLLCRIDGQILLYNEQAKVLFGRVAAAPGTQEGLVGLGRSLFRLFHREPVAHALDKLQGGLDQGAAFPTTKFVCSSVTGALMKVRMAPVLSTDGNIAGMLLTIEDVTQPMDHEGRQRSLMRAFAAEVRAPVANLNAAAGNLKLLPEMKEAGLAALADAVATESHRVSELIADLLSGYAESLRDGIALEDMRAEDLLDFARRRIESVLGLPCDAVPASGDFWIRADSFALVEALAFLAWHLRDDYGVRSVGLRVAVNGNLAELDLVWTGAIVASDAVSHWETQPMQVGSQQSPLTLKDVLDRHGGEVRLQANKTSQSAWFRLLLPLGAPVTASLRPFGSGSRPEFYDFDLFRDTEAAQGLFDRKLVDLTYTVFDTETTGLEPSAGDEIISLGAVRIVNARLLQEEVFERLVDPKRPVGRAASAIHGIEGGALAGRPAIGEVLPQFHRFCEDSVMVAHNAAFDMRFLELKEMATGIRFSQPVLDTLLLSVIVHPNQEGHTLEAIADRLGVSVVGRHTALGDALLTGEILLRFIPLLAERGILTLGQALGASRETYYARLRY